MEDAASIHLALLQLTRPVAEDGVSPDQARLLLYALQLASANLKHLAPGVTSAATAEQPPAFHPVTRFSIPPVE